MNNYLVKCVDESIHIVKAKDEVRARSAISTNRLVNVVFEIPVHITVLNNIIENSIYSSYNKTNNSLLEVRVEEIANSHVSCRVLKEGLFIESSIIVLPIKHFKQFFNLKEIQF